MTINSTVTVSILLIYRIERNINIDVQINILFMDIVYYINYICVLMCESVCVCVCVCVTGTMRNL